MAKHRCVPVNKLESLQSSNRIPCAKPSVSCQSSLHGYDLSSDDAEYLTPNTVAELTPKRSDWAARLLITARLYLNLPAEPPNNWGQINPNLNDYHSDLTHTSSTFWSPDITDWRHQPEDTHSKSADLSNVGSDIFSIIPNGVGVEVNCSRARDVIGRRQSITTSRTLRKKVVV